MPRNLFRLLVMAVAVTGSVLVGDADGSASATPSAHCPIAAPVRTGVPDHMKEYCDRQYYDELIPGCQARFSTSDKRRQCYELVNQWYADCLTGKHYPFRWAHARLPKAEAAE
ncbi:hypothetical protein BJY24_007349 [Nocardia transvalensis]|uniref:Uncharacterized protein n=1 Tax=Nocardia transvalensis TaxID=37333 RepID=A0A7W9UMJ8_9NOCA|nr:hypothetical protein [Nocardia transvalensis]MBB5918437.1 hypothetical protein [Nocardia transvalensis]